MPDNCQTPRGHMANLVAKAQREGPLDAAGMCPLMMQTLQLLPIRYGRVEDLDPSRELSMPYTLESRPLGFRLIRDGFLYVIVVLFGRHAPHLIPRGSAVNDVI